VYISLSGAASAAAYALPPAATSATASQPQAR
jgi:hypothetical protein